MPSTIEPAEDAASERRSGGAPLRAWWLGRIGYREAWALQHRLVAARAAGRLGDQLLLLEHDPVLTLGRNADPGHVLAPPDLLRARGVEVVRVERGGEVTYHGPGQLVAYPVVGLDERGLLLRPYVRLLETAMTETCRAFGVPAQRREGHPGCWLDPEGPLPRKIGALGIRVERGVAYHGIALNVTVELADFEFIDPCGMPGLTSASIALEAAWPRTGPTTSSVARAATVFAPYLAAGLGAPLIGELPPFAEPAAAPAELEGLLARDAPALPAAAEPGPG
ncbi:MAG TPA: lipoyl(octanoyl) transferase LipB [Candidatus Limnocylindrales bacterium]